MNKLTAELLHQLKSAAQEEIMCREASDTSDAWQDLASPENVLALLEIALPVLEQQEAKCEKCNGTGEMDSGGAQPWGDAIMVKCDCQFQPSTTPQIDNDGWIEWKGGECPLLLDSQKFQAKLRSGCITPVLFKGGRWFWRHDEQHYDIIAYRVIENDGREG